MSAAPLTRPEAEQVLADLIRTGCRAGRSPSELLAAADALAASWPAEIRPDRATVDRCLSFYGSKPLLPTDPPPAKEQPSAPPVFASERMLAERLAAGPLRQSMRYIPTGPDAGWRAWSSDCWPACPEPIPRQFAAEVHREVGNLLAAGLLDQRTARAMETTASMRGVLSQVCAYSEVQLDPSEVDPPGMLATVGGVLDFRAGGVLSEADPATCTFLRCSAVGFDHEAQHDAWDTVAAHVASMPGGDVVQRFLGASMLGVPPDRKALFLIGEGGGGKGTLLRSCLAALGDFGTVIPTEALTGGGRGAHGHELLSGLATARLGFSSELEGALDWSAFKAMTGGDPRTSKRLHGRRLEYQPRIWLAIACNHAPRPPDSASRDRCIVVPWVKPSCPDGSIVALLATPGPERNAYLRACLRWLVDGCRAFQRDGLGVPDFARAEVEPEGLAGWLDSRVEAGAIIVGRGYVTFADLFADACRWAREQGHETPTEQAAGGFLGTRLAGKRRLVDGRKVMTYTATLVDALGRAPNRLPITCEIDGFKPVQARPPADDLAGMPDPCVVGGLP